jgi:hypothetical protein
MLRPRPLLALGLALGLALAASTLTAAGCGKKLSSDEAVKVVERYNAALVKAYRSSDARMMEGLTGEEEGRKLTGLIGVKLDMDLYLDAELTESKVIGVSADADGAQVLTEERWHYADRRIGSGAQVAQDSRDHYFMRYSVRRGEKGQWVVAKVEFAREPTIGRTDAPNRADVATMHGTGGDAPPPAAPHPLPSDGGPGAAPRPAAPDGGR